MDIGVADAAELDVDRDIVLARLARDSPRELPRLGS
jgi:hypothetical protein